MSSKQFRYLTLSLPRNPGILRAIKAAKKTGAKLGVWVSQAIYEKLARDGSLAGKAE